MLTAVAADKLIDSSESLQINHSGNRILDGSLEIHCYPVATIPMRYKDYTDILH